MSRFITKSVGILASVALALTATFGCANNEEPPELPPVTSLTTNLEAPAAAPDTAKNADINGTGVHTNFANAWVRVKVLQLYGAGIILIPGTVMAAALTQQPTLRGDTWVWSVTALGATADLEVRGAVNEGWDIDLLISNTELDRYLWIEGNFALDLSEGIWTAHDANLPAGADDVLDIRWTYVSDTERTLVFENTNQSSPDVGDVLTYSVSGNTATLRFDDASEANQIAEITWDSTTGLGSIQVPDYNNGERACWNAAFENAACQ